MYPKLWIASGLPYPKLIDRLLTLAMERHKEKHETRFSRD
jgi:D-alanine-D-alanine ligase